MYTGLMWLSVKAWSLERVGWGCYKERLWLCWWRYASA